MSPDTRNQVLDFCRILNVKALRWTESFDFRSADQCIAFGEVSAKWTCLELLEELEIIIYPNCLEEFANAIKKQSALKELNIDVSLLEYSELMAFKRMDFKNLSKFHIMCSDFHKLDYLIDPISHSPTLQKVTVNLKLDSCVTSATCAHCDLFERSAMDLFLAICRSSVSRIDELDLQDCVFMTKSVLFNLINMLVRIEGVSIGRYCTLSSSELCLRIVRLRKRDIQVLFHPDDDEEEDVENAYIDPKQSVSCEYILRCSSDGLLWGYSLIHIFIH
ncbi:hypothetical protein HK098_003990 [Nowakowskiella sp. JEL0407]|nr:hypothetical protein HK098_003990 [Nowakowskiella sp. JEL0407]